jgi:mannose-6-phosphate isomerase-like protein (cupin superfamily)
MSSEVSKGYEILSLDDLEPRESASHGDALLMPLRHRLGLRAFGANCWTAPAGKQIVPTHEEESGDEELYVVVRGRATFTLDGAPLDAPAGTLVHALPGETREAVAEEAGTLVLAVGATPGEAFESRGWDEVVVAFAAARAGDVGGGRALMEELAARVPARWEGAYNLACFEALFGNHERAFTELQKALAFGHSEVLAFALGDSDLQSLHDDPRWQELLE